MVALKGPIYYAKVLKDVERLNLGRLVGRFWVEKVKTAWMLGQDTRLTLSVCSRTPTFAPSTPSVSVVTIIPKDIQLTNRIRCKHLLSDKKSSLFTAAT